MSEVIERVTFHLNNGETVQASFGPEGWQQWGANEATAYVTMPLVEAIEAAAAEDGELRVLLGIEEGHAELTGESGVCVHCERTVYLDSEGYWVDPEATGDDSIWREVCDANEGSFKADHEVEGGE